MGKLSFFLKSLNVYVRYKLKKYLPFLVIFTLTNRCNLKCRYCFNTTTVFNKKWDLPIEAIYSAIDDILKLRIPVISFSGGEPLVHKDFYKICEYIKNKPVVSNLNTNGTLIDKSNAHIIAHSFDFVRISLDGPEEVHDNVTGVNRSYEKTLKGINYLMSIKKRRAKIGINLVVSENNFLHIKQFIRNMQYKIDFISLLPEFCFDQNPKRKLNTRLKDLSLQNIYDKNIISGSDEFLNYLSLTKSDECGAGKLYLSIFCDGSVMRCPFFKRGTLFSKNKNFILGNIKSENLINILKKTDYKFQNYTCNGCYATCTSEITRVFRLSPLKLIIKFPELIKGYKLL